VKSRAMYASLLLCAAIFSPAIAADSQAPITATIRGALDALNADDAAKAGTYFTPVSDVVDDFAPYHWSGAGAAAAWWRSVDRVNAAVHITNIHAAMRGVARLRTSGDRAYAVVPLLITYVNNGKHDQERGLWTLTLRRTGSSWMIETAAYANLNG
jgi:hypothetical protein